MRQLYLVIPKQRLDCYKEKSKDKYNLSDILKLTDFNYSSPPYFVIVSAESKEQAAENAFKEINEWHDDVYSWTDYTYHDKHKDFESIKIKKSDLIVYSGEDISFTFIPTGCC